MMSTDVDQRERIPETFEGHKAKTVADIREVIKLLEALATRVQEGDMKAFEKFWIEGGTEEGDAKIDAIRQMLILRYVCREESLA
jgi:hypothetical protein